MAEFKISDNDLSSLKDKVAIVTGNPHGTNRVTNNSIDLTLQAAHPA